MRTAISIPDDLFDRFEAAARRAGMNRSEFYREAARAYVGRLEEEAVTAAVDAYIERSGDDGSDPEWTDGSIRRLAAATAGDEW